MSAIGEHAGVDGSEQPKSAVLAEFFFTLTVADLIAAQRAHLRGFFGRLGRRKVLWVLILLAVLSGVVGAWLVAHRQASGESLLGVAFIVGCGLVGGVLGCLAQYLLMPRYCRRLLRQQKSLSERWHAELGEDGLRVTSLSQNGFVSWANYVAWHCGEHMILLYHSDRLFQMIPVRAVTALAQTVFDSKLASVPRR